MANTAQKQQGNPTMTAVIVIAVVVVLGLLVWFLWVPHSSKNEPIPPGPGGVKPHEKMHMPGQPPPVNGPALPGMKGGPPIGQGGPGSVSPGAVPSAPAAPAAK